MGSDERRSMIRKKTLTKENSLLRGEAETLDDEGTKDRSNL